MEQLKISVIIPVYNVSRYLRKCLDSVRNQTYQNLEILVIDDGSTDGCGEICDAYARKDERIRVVHQKNRGLSAARNAALRIMTGDLVGFVDSDDWIEADYYEELEKHMRDTGADIVISGRYCVYQNITKECWMYPEDAPYDAYSGLKALSEDRIQHLVWDKLYRKHLFDGLTFREGRICEDVLIMYQLILRASRIDCLNTYGYYQIMRKSSIFNSPGSAAGAFWAYYELWQDLKERENIPEEIIDNFFRKTAEWAFWTLYKDFYACRKKQPDLFLKAKKFWNNNHKKIASINRKYRLIVYVPFPFRIKSLVKGKLPRVRSVWRNCRKILGKREQEEFFE